MTILNLREHSPDGGIGGVAVQDELTFISGKSQDISSNESIFQLLEGSLSFWRPEERCPLFRKGVQRSGNNGKVGDESTVILTESHKRDGSCRGDGDTPDQYDG